jgi:integrase/recombinase XerD
MLDSVNIPVALLKDERLSLSDMKVYAALVLLSEEGKKCSPTRDEIQRVSNVQRVSRYTQNLYDYGHIQIEKGSNGNRNIYTLICGDEMNKSDQICLKDFKDEFLEYSLGVHSRKTHKTHRTAFQEFIRVEGNKPLNAIGVREIEHFLSVKKREASEWTARKYYGSLAAAFQKAVHWEHIKVNPFKKVKKPKPPELFPLYFSEKEFNSMLSVMYEKDFKELCVSALLSGLRLGELLSLQWKDVDSVSKIILVRNSETFTTKSRKNRAVPISDELFEMFMQRKENIRNESDFVFHDPKGNQLKEKTVSQKFKKYVRRAKLNDKLHFHSLRHTFATHLVKKSVPLFAIQKLLGHSTSKTTEVYSHLLPQQLHREVNILAGMFKFNN